MILANDLTREKRRDRWFFAAICACLLLPHFFQHPLFGAGPWHLGLPHAITGDEPHYLVMINSVLEDGDLNVRNNYESVYLGSLQAGRTWSGQPLDHHTLWFQGEARIRWQEVYDWSAWTQVPLSTIPRDTRGVLIPQRRAGTESQRIDPNHPEYMQHPPGLALLLAPVLYPLHGTKFLEPAAVFCSFIVTVVSVMFFWSWMQKYSADAAWNRVVVAVTFLGTPSWHYARALYTEPYMVLCTAAAYGLALTSERAALSGLFIGVGVLMKAPYALLAIPLFLYFFLQRQFAKAASFALPVFIAVLVTLALNAQQFGSPFRQVYAWQSRSVWEGLGVVLFDWHGDGIVPFVPAVLVALFGWPRLIREHGLDAFVIALGFLLYAGVMVLWPLYGLQYGPRLVLPVLILPLVGLIEIPRTSICRLSVFRVVAAALLGLSVLINFLGAVPPWKNISKHPLVELLRP